MAVLDAAKIGLCLGGGGVRISPLGHTWSHDDGTPLGASSNVESISFISSE